MRSISWPSLLGVRQNKSKIFCLQLFLDLNDAQQNYLEEKSEEANTDDVVMKDFSAKQNDLIGKNEDPER